MIFCSSTEKAANTDPKQEHVKNVLHNVRSDAWYQGCGKNRGPQGTFLDSYQEHPISKVCIGIELLIKEGKVTQISEETKFSSQATESAKMLGPKEAKNK